MKRTSLIFTLFITLILGANSYAHTGLKSSVPNNNAMLVGSPEVIKLKFMAKVNLVKFEVVSKISGYRVEVNFIPSVTASATFSVAVPELAIGDYQVNWGLLGGDGHQITGSFEFMVQGAGLPMRDHGEMAMPTTTEGEVESSGDQQSHSGQ
jgi:methionine-rich copper-binding protein CopC